MLEGENGGMRELVVVVPLGDLPAQLGVAAATDQLDLVCHLGGHGGKEGIRAAAGTTGTAKVFFASCCRSC